MVPLVYCVIVNWNGWSDTSRCLESLVKQTHPRLTILVVDNDSHDDSVANIRDRFPEVRVIGLDENGGFAKANNVGIRIALEERADCIWLLNNDTVVPPDTASKMVAKMSTSPEIGAVGSVLYFLNSPGQIQAWGGGHVSTFFAYSSHFERPRVFGDGDFVTFASVLLSKQAALSIGMLDEQFFMYFEDADYCLRLSKAGFLIAVAENTAVLHREGGSSKKNVARLDRNVTRSGLIFLSKHSRAPRLSKAIFVLLRLGKRVASLKWANAFAVWKGWRDYSDEAR